MNEDVPKLLRTIANSADAKANKHDIIFNAAALEIEEWRSCARYDVLMTGPRFQN